MGETSEWEADTMTSPDTDVELRCLRSMRRAGVVACVLLVVLCSAAVLLSYRMGFHHGARGAASALPPEFGTLGELYGHIERQAIRVPGDAALVKGAIDGMLGALGDRHAVYYDSKDFAAFGHMLEGEFSGVGIRIDDSVQGPVVVSVLQSTPAAKAGVVAGERIVSVNGRDVRKLTIDHVAALITGEPGTPVTIGFEGGPAGPRELRITRSTIQLPDVESKLEGRIGHITLLQFSNRVGARIRQATMDLTAKGARGIVLDLRGNPGGLLREAVEVASVFVEDGVIVTVRSRADGNGAGQSYRAQGDALEGLPLVVLVDGGSASASEIVAGAIQDLQRGEIVGEKTYGKGTVQTVEALRGGGGVKFTTAEYLTSSGDSIEGVGVIPDRQVAGADAQLAAAREELMQLLAATSR
jgi:carboxyl-terminal processing protease